MSGGWNRDDLRANSVSGECAASRLVSAQATECLMPTVCYPLATFGGIRRSRLHPQEKLVPIFDTVRANRIHREGPKRTRSQETCCAGSRLAPDRQLLPNLDDGTVEYGVGVMNNELPLLGQRENLIVAGQQDWLDVKLPLYDRLTPQR